MAVGDLGHGLSLSATIPPHEHSFVRPFYNSHRMPPMIFFPRPCQSISRKRIRRLQVPLSFIHSRQTIGQAAKVGRLT